MLEPSRAIRARSSSSTSFVLDELTDTHAPEHTCRSTRVNVERLKGAQASPRGTPRRSQDRPETGPKGGPREALRGASSAVLERWKLDNARKPKTHKKKQMKINDFCLLGPSRDASRISLGASRGHLFAALGHGGTI